MVKGFLKGGLVGALIVGALLLGVGLLDGARSDALLAMTAAAALAGTGAGGVVGAVRAAERRKRWVLGPTARLASEPIGEAATAPDVRLSVTVSAVYALALSMIGSLVVLAVLGRDVTSWVGAVVPFDVTPVHARAMVAATIYLGTLLALAELPLRRGAAAAGLGLREHRLVVGAGFLAGLLALPSLAVILG